MIIPLKIEMIFFLKKDKYLKWSDIVEAEVKLFPEGEIGQPRYLGNFQS